MEVLSTFRIWKLCSLWNKIVPYQRNVPQL